MRISAGVQTCALPILLGDSLPLASASPTRLGKALDSSCKGETLTDTLMWLGQAAAPAHARRSTHAPMSAIRPTSSATGMNSAGDMRPRVECFQRINAPNPPTSAVWADTTIGGASRRVTVWDAV